MGQGRGQWSHRGPPPPTTTTTAISYVDRFEDLYLTTTHEEHVCMAYLSDQNVHFDDNSDIEHVYMTTDEAPATSRTHQPLPDTPAGPPTVLGLPHANNSNASTSLARVSAVPVPQPRSQQEIDMLREELRRLHGQNMTALDLLSQGLATGNGNGALNGAEASSAGMPGATRETVPGVTGDEVVARLSRLWDPTARPMAASAIPEQQSEAEAERALRRQHRQDQLNAHVAVNVLPIVPPDPSGWRPPYAWDPTQANAMPAFFTHPRFANGPQFPQAIADPPITPEVFSTATGIPLQIPRRATNTDVRNMTDQLHQLSIFRTGDNDYMAYTAFGPTPPDGEPTLPPGLIAEPTARPNRPLLQELTSIHHMQQANMQRMEQRRRKGKGRGHASAQRPGASTAVHRYLGDDTQCTICVENFYHKELVLRVSCNHLIHENCWDDFILQQGDGPRCPKCRGPGIVQSLFRYVGPTSSAEAVDSARRATRLYHQQHPTQRDDSNDFTDAQSNAPTDTQSNVPSETAFAGMTFFNKYDDEQGWGHLRALTHNNDHASHFQNAPATSTCLSKKGMRAPLRNGAIGCTTHWSNNNVITYVTNGLSTNIMILMRCKQRYLRKTFGLKPLPQEYMYACPPGHYH